MYSILAKLLTRNETLYNKLLDLQLCGNIYADQNFPVAVGAWLAGTNKIQQRADRGIPKDSKISLYYALCVSKIYIVEELSIVYFILVYNGVYCAFQKYI